MMMSVSLRASASYSPESFVCMYLLLCDFRGNSTFVNIVFIYRSAYLGQDMSEYLNLFLVYKVYSALGHYMIPVNYVHYLARCKRDIDCSRSTDINEFACTTNCLYRHASYMVLVSYTSRFHA
jgi:hypothetical protein